MVTSIRAAVHCIDGVPFRETAVGNGGVELSVLAKSVEIFGEASGPIICKPHPSRSTSAKLSRKVPHFEGLRLCLQDGRFKCSLRANLSRTPALPYSIRSVLALSADRHCVLDVGWPFFGAAAIR